MDELTQIWDKRIKAALEALHYAQMDLELISPKYDPDIVGSHVGSAIFYCDNALLELKNLDNEDYEVPAEDGWAFDR